MSRGGDESGAQDRGPGGRGDITSGCREKKKKASKPRPGARGGRGRCTATDQGRDGRRSPDVRGRPRSHALQPRGRGRQLSKFRVRRASRCGAGPAELRRACPAGRSVGAIVEHDVGGRSRKPPAQRDQEQGGAAAREAGATTIGRRSGTRLTGPWMWPGRGGCGGNTGQRVTARVCRPP